NKKSYESKEITVGAFTDNNKIASWAKDSVTLSSELGIIKGMSNGEFAPDENTNRAQAAVMLYRMYKVVMR
ncbi:MAG: S-layer homology domain-containing protein, partial [Clostridia bacterium]|nr:S-layer homology domain-containing protein [Clostridia bacterium]